jgi:putative FmdB family regulatory protein
MPTYEYRCKECGRELEVVQSFTDDALTTCDSCGGRLRKVFGAIGITFKGSGFYKTDSRSSSSSTSSSSSASSSDSGGSSTSGSGDSKTGDSKAGDKKAEKKSDSSTAAATSAS